MFNRTGGQPSTKSKRVSRDISLDGPTKGWIKSRSINQSVKGGAEVLRNIFPTREGGELRGGSVKHAQCGSKTIRHIAVYDTGAAKMFAADENKIYDISAPDDPNVSITPDVTGLTSDDWTSLQFTTPGGNFLVMVNGRDEMRQYDGSTWKAINDVSSPSVTGINTAHLKHVWKFKNRLFFVEKESMSAWYLPVLSIGGSATEIPLGGIFSHGGELLFGATLSKDSGDGQDDACLFVTSRGEVAVYEGTDPTSASTWGLVGVYRIGAPVDKNASFKAGGDLAIMTDDGITSVLAMMTKDRVGLLSSSISAPIEDEFKSTIANRKGAQDRFSMTLWPEGKMLIVGLPKVSGVAERSFISNALSGAWAEYTGWQVRCSAVFGGKLYAGAESGKILQLNVTGADEGAPYQGVYVPIFSNYGSPSEKSALEARIVAKTDYPFNFQLFASADYNADIPTPLSAPANFVSSAWDEALWDSGAVWRSGEEIRKVVSNWQTVYASGYALSPGVAVTSGQTTKPDITISEIHFVYEVGQVMG